MSQKGLEVVVCLFIFAVGILLVCFSHDHAILAAEVVGSSLVALKSRLNK